MIAKKAESIDRETANALREMSIIIEAGSGNGWRCDALSVSEWDYGNGSMVSVSFRKGEEQWRHRGVAFRSSVSETNGHPLQVAAALRDLAENIEATFK